MSRRGAWRHRVERLSGAGSLAADQGLLVLVARKGDWLVSGASSAGDSAILDAPGHVELTVVSGDEAELMRFG